LPTFAGPEGGLAPAAETSPEKQFNLNNTNTIY